VFACRRASQTGDLSTVANPECIPKIREEFDKWKRMNIPIN